MIPQKDKPSVKVKARCENVDWVWVYPKKPAKDKLCVQCFNLKECGIKEMQPNYKTGGILPSSEYGRKKI
jgi:hypothetical protein